MLKLQKSSLILILIIVVLTAGCVSIYTLGYTPGTVWHKAEDVKPGTFGQNVGSGNYNFNFPGNVGIKNTNPALELDVTGDIYATGQVIAGTKVKVGVSEMSSGKLTGLDRPTSANDATSKGYVDEQIAEVRAIATGDLPLVNFVHTRQECIDAGGEVVDSDVGFKQCRFNASTCPSGWTQYKSYTTTAANTCHTIVRGGSYTCIECDYCTTTSHAWQNTTERESCMYQRANAMYCGDCCGNATAYSCFTIPGAECLDTNPCTCYATITQIGCY